MTPHLLTALLCFITILGCYSYTIFLFYFNLAALKYFRCIEPRLRERDNKAEYNTLMQVDMPLASHSKEMAVLFMRIMGLVFPVVALFLGVAIIDSYSGVELYNETVGMVTALGISFSVVSVLYSRHQAENVNEACHHYDSVLASYELEDELDDPNPPVE